MDVERAPEERADVGHGQDAHVAGLADEAHLALLELADEAAVEALAIGEVLGIEPDRLHAGGTRAIERGRALPVGDHHRDARRKVGGGARVEQRLQVAAATRGEDADGQALDRKSTRLNSSHSQISYAVFCLKKKRNTSF